MYKWYNKKIKVWRSLKSLSNKAVLLDFDETWTIVPKKKFAIGVYLDKFCFWDEYPFPKVNTWPKSLEKERWHSDLPNW